MPLFAKGPDGGVIEHDRQGSKKRTYGSPAITPKPEVIERMRRHTLPVKLASKILRPLTSFLRSKGITGIHLQSSFFKDGYVFNAAVTLGDQQSKTAMFAEMPEGKFQVWP